MRPYPHKFVSSATATTCSATATTCSATATTCSATATTCSAGLPAGCGVGLPAHAHSAPTAERQSALVFLLSGGSLCASCLGERAERIIEATKEIEPQDIPERHDAILHSYLFSLLISPAMI